MSMRKFAWALMTLALVLAVVAPAAAGDDSTAKAGGSDPELRKEMRAMRAQMAAMQKRMEALEGQIAASGGASKGTGAGGSATAASGTAANSTGAPSAAIANRLGQTGNGVPPGITPADVSLGSPPGVTIGQALKQLMPGQVSGPQAPTIGTMAGESGPDRQGVIIPSVQGVPQIFIPDIGAVGDFTLQQSDYKKGDPRYDPSADKFNVRDTQIILFSPIDPYTNAQISIDKPNNGPFDIEEAFVVFDKLPYNIQLRAGQFRPVFGLLNQTDTFQLPIVNRPNALAFYITQDGFVEPGVNVSAYVPNPWDAAIKLDANMLSGTNTLAFDRHQGRNFDYAYMGTLSYARDLFGSGFMTAGASMAGGPGPGGQAYYADPFMQFQYAPDQRHIWTWNAEGLLVEQQGVGNHGLKRGVYTLLDYNFWLRYHAGFLVDIADRPEVARGTEAGFSPVLTYFLSDNMRVRVQYTHTTPSGPERSANTFFLQATFALGNLKPLD
jgi:hypothetical protein